MDPITLRVPEELADDLAAEADERGYSSRSEYVRRILRNRSDYESYSDRPQSEYASRDELEALRERVAALESDTAAAGVPPGRAGRSSRGEPRGSDGPEPAAEWQGVVLAEVDSPAIRNDPESFMDAIAAAVELLEDGPRTKSEFVDELADVHPVGYENTDTWWRRVGRPRLKNHPGVQSPPAGASKWRLSD